jgi:hypothetical protein
MKPDLTTLYSELGLKPNCSLAELQLAYRRRISELQPNRTGGAQSPESTAVLRDLIGLYTTASRFHRRYGRLPGAAPHQPGMWSSAVVGARRRYAEDDSPPPSGNRASSQPRIALALAVMLLVLLFVLIAMASGEWLR